ncbi:MAG TPA: TonB family protein, partial [Dongiaceae bacterium]|nr:TonB family protein [Dongiaceae bacterium]
AAGWERDGRTTGTLSGLLPSIVLHGAVLALLIAGLRGGWSGRPDETAPQAAMVSLVPVVPGAHPKIEPDPTPLPRWGLRSAAPEPAQPAETPDPLLEQTPLPEISSEMASLPLAVFATTKPEAAPIPPPDEDAVAIEPAKRIPPPASVKLRKALTAPKPAAPKPAAKTQPKPIAKPVSANSPAKPAAKPIETAGPVGDPKAEPQSAPTAASSVAAAPNPGPSPSSAPSSLSDAPVLVTNPNYAGACAIRYPERARRRNQEGTVLIHALIGTDGKPIEVTVASSSGHSLLDEAARDAIAQCAFVPQRIGGRAVKAIVEIPIPFKLI